MELGAIFLLLGVIVIVIIYVAQPFNGRWHIEAKNERAVSVLLANRENALNSLQELDFDYKLGKIPEEEYVSQHASLVKAGAEILRQLDTIQVEPPAQPGVAPLPPEPEQVGKSLSDEDLEDLIAKHRSVRQHKAGGFCPRCGKPILQSDQFCPSCGQVINS